MRLILSKTLKEAGVVEIAEAADGQQGLDYLLQNPDTSIALIDWNMPNMTGIEMAVAVRQHDHLTKVRLMMVTTETESEHMAQAVAAGVNAYVMKPFTKDVIVGKLRELGL